MFRITLSGPLSDAYTLANPSTSKWIRIYRWGNMWGECVDDDWSCEIRKQVAYCTEMNHHVVLEETQTVDCGLPFETDDVWDEEIYGKGAILYGNLLILKGTKEELYALCKSIAPEFLEWVRNHTQTRSLPVQTISNHMLEPVHPKAVNPTVQARIAKGPRTQTGFANPRTTTVRPVCLIE